MVYRAKITKIQGWVEDHYNLNAYTIVRDAKDVYIEVYDEDEAELLEMLNRYQGQWLRLAEVWHNIYESDK